MLEFYFHVTLFFDKKTFKAKDVTSFSIPYKQAEKEF